MRAPATICRSEMRARSKRAPGRTNPPTVASLGVQARLIPVDADREREITDLVTSYEQLRAEWERLFQRAIDLLGEDFRDSLDGSRSSSHPTCD